MSLPTMNWGGPDFDTAWNQIVAFHFATFPLRGGTGTATTTSPQARPVTPTFDPKLEANALYGKPMALSAGGYYRMGASPAPIVGPYINTGVVDFIVSFGVPANVAGDRKLYKIYLDNELAWSSVAGGTLPAHGTFAAEAFDFVFKPGTLTQTICSLETTHFPGDENAYRPQMLLQITGLPYQRFMDNTGKPVPYVACEIGDVTDGADPLDGINLGEALERVAHSPWAGYDASTFESVGIDDVVDAILIKDNFTVVQLCQSVTREYRNIDLVLSDIVRIKDRASSVDPDFVFDADSIIGGDVAISVVRSGATAQRREHELIAVDPDQDYTMVPSLSKVPRDPVVISAAVGKETATVPLVIDASTRQALATYAQNYGENARRKVSFTVGAAGYQIEPGDLFALVIVADGFDNEVFKCTQTTHGANWVVEVEGEAILRCSIFSEPETDPYFESVIFLVHCNGSENSTAFFDSSSYANPITAVNDARVSPNAKFGTGSAVFNGVDDQDYLNSGVVTLGVSGTGLSETNTSPYTIECWANFGSVGRIQYLVSIDTGLLGRFFRLWQNEDDELQFRWDDTGGIYDPANELFTTGANITPGVWYHVVADKDSTGKVRLYLNGVMMDSATPANSVIGKTGDPVRVGQAFVGYIDEVRITRGVSRYGDVYGDSSFTPPTEPFPDSS